MNKSEFHFIQDGGRIHAYGDGWELICINNKKIFKQSKKLPSLRVIKTAIKKLKQI